jgi:hypothetical protein
MSRWWQISLWEVKSSTDILLGDGITRMTGVHLTRPPDDMNTLDTFRKREPIRYILSILLGESQLYCNDISHRLAPPYVLLLPRAIDAGFPWGWG